LLNGFRQDTFWAMRQPRFESLDPAMPVVVGVGQAAGRLGTPGYRRRSPVDLVPDAARELLDLLTTAGQPIGQRVGVRSGQSGNLVRATA
jgi:hypothetical protein